MQIYSNYNLTLTGTILIRDGSAPAISYLVMHARFKMSTGFWGIKAKKVYKSNPGPLWFL